MLAYGTTGQWLIADTVADKERTKIPNVWGFFLCVFLIFTILWVMNNSTVLYIYCTGYLFSSIAHLFEIFNEISSKKKKI